MRKEHLKEEANLIERTLLRIEPEETYHRAWYNPERAGLGRFMLCVENTLDYFVVPLVEELTLVLSTHYSEEDCYEFVPGERRNFHYSRIVIDGKSTNIALYAGLEEKIKSFLKKHGKCYLSLEYDA